MESLFGRKVRNLVELKEITEKAMNRGQQGQRYIIVKEVELDYNAFRSFANDFFKDQPWITELDGGLNESGEIRCIRIVNKDTSDKVLVNSEGYNYPRYTAVENN